MADKLIVAPGCSIRYPAGVTAKGSGRPVLTQGEELPDGLFTPSQRKAHIDSGFAQVVSAADRPDPATMPKSIPDRPGESEAPPINAGSKGDSGSGSDPVTTDAAPTGVSAAGGIPDASDGGAGNVLAPSTVEQPVPGPEIDGAGSEVGPWIFNPADLQGKPLEELNVLIAARDDKVEPFGTVEEAIAYLSQNFVTE